MPQLIRPHQNSLASFSDRSSAEAAIQTLEAAGFAHDHLAIVPESLSPEPAVKETEAISNAGSGAIAGTVFGCMSGLLLGFMKVAGADVDAALTEIDPLQVFIGMTLAGAGIGAAGGGLIAALGGASVRKDAVETLAKPEESYVIVAEQMTPEQVIQAKQMLGQVDANHSAEYK
jgi:uncharacterized membrane protein